MNSRANSFNGVNATATAAFAIFGGKYVLTAHSAAWGGGSAQVQIMLNGNWIDVGTALTADGVSTVLYLPPGQARINVVTATADVSLASIPN